MNTQMYNAPGLWALAVGFVVAVVFGAPTINTLRILKFGQNINEDAPETHRIKQGTPTMGGVLIVVGTVLSLIAVMAVTAYTRSGTINLRSLSGLLAIVFVFLAHAAVGFIDDYRNIRGGHSLGLKAREKLFLQTAITAVFVVWRLVTADSITTTVCYWPGLSIDLGSSYYVLCALWMIGLSNAVNLTDGCDGLAGSLTILAALGISWTIFTNHSGSEWIPLFGYGLAGSSLGFLWFNAHPAKVFMGDTGSLAIGAGLAALCIVGKQEILGLLFMFVFLMEMVSVMIQVTVVRLTGGKATGKRVFKMTPIHHHFERCGWPETTVVQRFIILGAVALLVGMLLAPSFSSWVLLGQ